MRWCLGRSAVATRRDLSALGVRNTLSLVVDRVVRDRTDDCAVDLVGRCGRAAGTNRVTRARDRVVVVLVTCAKRRTRGQTTRDRRAVQLDAVSGVQLQAREGGERISRVL